MITGLGALCLLAVLFVAIRIGERAALATAVLSVLALNFFVVDPRYTLTVSDEEDIVALVVLLVAAVVVGRLAAKAREGAERAEDRARLATAREREAQTLAGAASALLEGDDLVEQLQNIGAGVERSTHGGLRLGLSAAPEATDDEAATRLPTETRAAWLYAREGAGWSAEDLERISSPLARLIDVAREREEALGKSADAEASRRADVAKTALLHAISHDLRSPLTAITTAAGGLRAAEISEADHAALNAVIEEEADRLARMVDDLLDLSKVQAGAVNPRPDWCDLHDVVQSAAAGVRARRGEHPIEFDLPGELPLVRADAAQLERVFSNLIENAVKFSPADAPVKISGGSGGGRVVVRVTDEGPGIAPSKQTQVFEPFFRGRHGGEGSGLGLAISRGLVEANDGKIELQSALDQGTSFAASFPLVRQPVA